MYIALPDDVPPDTPRACDQPFYFATIDSTVTTIESGPAAAAAAAAPQSARPCAAAAAQVNSEAHQADKPLAAGAPALPPPGAKAPASAGALHPGSAEEPLPMSRGAGVALHGAESQAHAAGKVNGAMARAGNGDRGMNGSASAVLEETPKGAAKSGSAQRQPLCGCSIC